MARIGTLPIGCNPCRCESPHLDSRGTIFLDNAGTYRVRYCQVCGGGYDSVRTGEPVPGDAKLSTWRCERCGADNLDPGPPRCTACPPPLKWWLCPECGVENAADQPYCVRCKARWTPLIHGGTT
jgi:hypothetical protein